MLRRLRIWFVRLLTGQGEHERLARLLSLLQSAGVEHYKTATIDVSLRSPERPALADGKADRGGALLTDNELLFGESEERLRRQGLVG